jgi:energy-coupling factor transport system permease protein
MLPIYRKKGTLLHSLHVSVVLALVAAVAGGLLVLDHPLYLLLLGLGTLGLVRWARLARESQPYTRVGGTVAVLVFFLNPLFNRNGDHVLVFGPRIPVLGKLDITLEAVLYGALAAWRVFFLVLVFGLAGMLLDPDEVLRVISPSAWRTSLALGLSVRMYPTLVTEAQRMREAQLARGVPLESGGRWDRFRARLPLWMSLFRDSLERASALAESMAARGFGSGRRTHWKRRGYRPRDGLVALGVVVPLATAVVLGAVWGGYSLFPSPDPLGRGLSPWTVAGLSLPLAVLGLASTWWRGSREGACRAPSRFPGANPGTSLVGDFRESHRALNPPEDLCGREGHGMAMESERERGK